MYINYYGKNIENSIVLPVYVYEIKVRSILPRDRKKNNVDVLGEAILGLLDGMESIDIDYLANTLGIPSKYKKLLQYEVNELSDNGYITTDENGKILSLNKLDEKELENFYVIYDRVNNLFLDCIVSKNELDKRMIYRDENLNSENNYFIKIEKRYTPDRYKVCYLIQQLITKSNKTAKYDENDSDYSEIDEVIRPFYHISLETVENADNPIEANFLYKVSLDKEMEVIYETPFIKDNYSAYIENNILPNVDKNKLKSIIKRFDFIDTEMLKNQIKSYVKEYSQYDKDSVRLEHIDKIAYYQSVLSLNGEEYKKIASTISNFDKIAKSVLKEIVDKFGESRFEKKNIKVRYFNELEEINDICIINSFIDDNIKIIYKDLKVIRGITQTSIVSYLKAIYLSKYFTGTDLDKRVFDLFSTDKKLIQFLNDVWLYRNNTGHNVERGAFYNSAYDLDNMEKSRLKEVMDELGSGLIYFIKTVKGL